MGPNTLPCGTPRLTLSQVEKVSANFNSLSSARDAVRVAVSQRKRVEMGVKDIEMGSIYGKVYSVALNLVKNEDQILHYCDVTQQIFVIQNS